MKKKLLSLTLAAAVCAGLLAGCGSNSSSSAASDANTSASQSGDAAGSEDTAQLSLIEDGKLVMSTNAEFPPYEVVADGEGVNGTGFEGIDIEIACALADKLGLELVIDDMDFDSALMAVQEGRSDLVLAGLTYTEERDLVMDFTDSYATGVQVVIVPEDSDITSIDDLSNVSMIGTQRGTTGYIYCSDTVENGGYGEDHVTAYDSGATAVQALMNGQVDCVVIDNAPAQEYVKANPGLKILDTEFVTEDYCIAVSEGNTALQEALNDALNELIADGTVQSILDKYITAE